MMRSTRPCLLALVTTLALLLVGRANAGVHGVPAAAGDSRTSGNTSSNTTARSNVQMKYMSTSEPWCGDSAREAVVRLSAENRNLFEQCHSASHGYALLPYSGLLPSDDQIRAIIASRPCLLILDAIRQLPTLNECNFGGLPLKAAVETLLMTSQDLDNRIAPLTRDQFFEFVTWRHTRNVAQELRKPFDNRSESAVSFELQLAAAAAQLRVSLSDKLVIRVNGTDVGAKASVVPPNVSAGAGPKGEIGGEAVVGGPRQTAQTESLRSSSRSRSIPTLTSTTRGLVVLFVMWTSLW